MEAIDLVLEAPLLKGYVHPHQNTEAGTLRFPSNQSVTQQRNTICWYVFIGVQSYLDDSHIIPGT